MSLVVIKPLAITDAMLVSCNVPETDYPAYDAGVTYVAGNRVIVPASHTVYEAIATTIGADANIGRTPASSPLWWVKVSATNRWRSLDTKVSSKTSQALTLSYRITPGQVVNAVAVLNCYADSVRIRVVDPAEGTVYDKTTSLLGNLRRAGWYDWFFSRRVRKSQVVALDLPSYYGADILVDVAVASGEASMGVLMIGYQQAMGDGVQYGARAGITDYSRKTVNQWGDTELIELAYAKRASFSLRVKNSEIDALQEQLAELRATPCLWVGVERYACMSVFGWSGDFEILISYAIYSDCSLDLKGLT